MFKFSHIIYSTNEDSIRSTGPFKLPPVKGKSYDIVSLSPKKILLLEILFHQTFTNGLKPIGTKKEKPDLKKLSFIL